MENSILVKIENQLNIINRKLKSGKTAFSMQGEITDKMKSFSKNYEKGFEDHLYNYIKQYMLTHNDKRFIRSNGEINISKFCDYVPMEYKTWYDKIKNNNGTPPTDKTMLRIVFALKMNLSDADEFLRMAGIHLTPLNDKYNLVIALLELGIYDREIIIEAFDFFGPKGHPPFGNIY